MKAMGYLEDASKPYIHHKPYNFYLKNSRQGEKLYGYVWHISGSANLQ